VDFGAVHEHAPGSLVDAERADLPGASGSSLAVPAVVFRAPCYGPDPGYEFAHSERLDQIIVGAQLQSQYAVNFLVAGADNNDRGRGQSTDGTAKVCAVHVRQPQIQEDEIGTGGAYFGKCTRTVRYVAGLETCPRQSFQDAGGH
jgi:hypothetical protein